MIQENLPETPCKRPLAMSNEFGAHEFGRESVGIGLRQPHMEEFIENAIDIDWLEVHSENYMQSGPRLDALRRIRHHYPISAHGVGLSLGSAEGLDKAHLERLRRFVEDIQPVVVSEHIAWSVASGTYLNDLLPLPYTQEALNVICQNIDQCQTYLSRQILVENPSTYLSFTETDMMEWDFISAIHQRTGCGILLDINNIFVSARNHDFDAETYLRHIPAAAVGEYHLAGHNVNQTTAGAQILIDTHSQPVSQDVWSLYETALKRIGPRPTLVEWDLDIPPLENLLIEANKARNHIKKRRSVNESS